MLYFFFEGHRPSIVPPEGGWLVAAGHDLANASAHKLELRVRGSGRSVAKLAARPLGADALAVWLPPETLAPHAGDCLSLMTETADPAETGAAIAHAAFETALPLCVPQATSTLYRLGVWLEYSTPSRLAALDRKSLEFRNESCDESVAVSERLVWEEAGRGELIDLRAESLVEVNAPAIDCAADGARIRCVGTLPPAICEPGEEGELVAVQPTEWAHAFAPTLSTAEQEYESQGLSRFIEAEDGSPLCVALTRDAVSEVSHMRFRLIAANARQRSVFFESPVETLRAHLEARYDSPPHRIDVEFRAGDAAQSGRVCVTLESDPCGF